MKSPYPDFFKNERTSGVSPTFYTQDIPDSDKVFKDNPLINTAQALLEARPHPSRLSPMVLMTDPNLIPDPVDAARQLPRGSAIIYRHFGAVDKLKTAKTLRDYTLEHGQQFLIGNDPELAIEVEADGVHFRRDAALIAPSVWRKHQPKWLITMAGVKEGYLGYTQPLTCLDGLFISSIFKSESETAGPPIGISAFKELCTKLDVPVFALGGVNTKTVSPLKDSGAAGIAGISGIMTGMTA